MRMDRIARAALAPLALALAAPLVAQEAPPGTDIFLASLEVRDGQPFVGRPVNVTDRDGYDNQPNFTPDGRTLLYTSIREDGQADIYRYDLAAGVTHRLTRTAESEYSPTSLPDDRGFTVVRVEADSTQRLWQFDPDGGTPGLVLTSVRPVGYHAWADAGTVALFVLGSPPTLRIADVVSGRVETVAEGIGRSLHRIPGRRSISFVQSVTGTERRIREYDLETHEIRDLVRPLDPGEDYAWTPDGAVLMGRGEKLFRWDPRSGAGWVELADLAAAGVRGITRLAVSPDGGRIAIVAERVR